MRESRLSLLAGRRSMMDVSASDTGEAVVWNFKSGSLDRLICDGGAVCCGFFDYSGFIQTAVPAN